MVVFITGRKDCAGASFKVSHHFQRVGSHKHFLDGNTRVFFLDITIVQARSDTSNQQQDKWISSPTNTKLTVAARLHSEDQFFLLPLLSLSWHVNTGAIVSRSSEKCMISPNFVFSVAAADLLDICSLILEMSFCEHEKESCSCQRTWSVLMGLAWLYWGFQCLRIHCSRFHGHSSQSFKGAAIST